MTAPTMPVPPPAKKPRRWGRRLLLLALVLLLLVAFAPFLVGLPLVRDRIAALASEAVGRPVALQRLAASWTKGIDVDGIRVDSPAGFEEPLATVKHVHVDVDLAALLRGRLDAAVEVQSPWITFLRDEEGASNTDDLFVGGRREARDAESTGPGPRPRLRLKVRDGLLRARGAKGGEPQEVRDLDADLGMDPDGRIEVRLEAVASRAAPGGEDAAISLDGVLPAEGEGPLHVAIPELDLARIAELVECASGVCDLRGRVAVALQGKTAPGPVFSGELRADARELALRLPDGNAFAVQSLEIVGTLLPGAATSIGDVRVRARQVVLGPGPLSVHGYVEPEILVHLETERPTGGGVGPTIVRLKEARSALLTVQPVAGRPPPTLTAPSAVSGEAQAALDLAAVGGAFGALLRLEPTDRMAGVVRADVRVAMDGERGEAHATLQSTPITLPASWGSNLPATRLEGQADARATDGEVTLSVPRLAGLGFDVNARATLTRRGESLEASEAHVAWKADLQRSRPILLALLDLAPREQLAGAVASTVELRPDGTGLALRGQTTVSGFGWRDADGRVRIQGADVRVDHEAVVAREPGTPHRLDAIRVSLPGLEGVLTGTLTPGEDALDLDGRLSLRGDAGRLAPLVAGFLGEGYADLKGRGALEGVLALRGLTGRGGERLLANGHLGAGAWSTGGLEVTGARLEFERASAAVAQTVRFVAQVNGGTLKADAGFTPGPRETPWQAALDAKGIDTSTLLVSHGLGRFLTYLFPTIVPMDASTNVLSGKLDATLNLAAADIGGERLAPTLAGQGKILMAQGRIGDSTLFQVATRGGGLGKIGPLLAAAVPEIGRELEGLSRHLTFRSLESTFVVEREVLTIRHGMLEGDRVNIAFPGRVAFDQRMDLKVLVTLGGKAGERLGRILPSKTIPLTARGTLSAPVLTPELKASDLQGGALKGLIPGVGEGNPVEKLRDLFGR